MNEVTRVLNLVGGDPRAAADLLTILYDELRGLARARMARERPGHTLQATALVHEAYLRLVEAEGRTWANRAHFFGTAAEAMRRILIEHARRRCSLRRGADAEHLPVDELPIVAPGGDEEMLGLHESLQRLEAHDPAKAELVKLRYFAGLTMEEAAEVLGLSLATAKRQWSYARAWLFRDLRRD